jgi:hypothetical protein
LDKETNFIKHDQAIFSRGSRVTALNCTVLILGAGKSNRTTKSSSLTVQLTAISFRAISNQAIFSRGSRTTALNFTVIRMEAGIELTNIRKTLKV